MYEQATNNIKMRRNYIKKLKPAGEKQLIYKK